LQKDIQKSESQPSTEKTSSKETDVPEEIVAPEGSPLQEDVAQPEEGLNNFIGKLSQRKNMKQNIEAKILGFRDPRSNSEFSRQFASLEQSFVLGISTKKISHSDPKENVSLKKYLYKINLYLNDFILRFQK
jgi:hypothetical protein